MLTHLARDMGRNNMAVLKLNTEHGIGKRVYDDAVHLKRFFFRHAAVFLTGLLALKTAAFCLKFALNQSTN